MNNFNTTFKLIMILAVAVGSLLLYFLYLILFTPNGVLGVL